MRTPPGAVALTPIVEAEPSPSAAPVVHEPGEVVRLGAVLQVLSARGQKLPVEALASLGLMLVEALPRDRDAHFRGTRPDDVLLTRAGLVRVVQSRSGQGVRMHPVGSFRWLSPELVRGMPPTTASDVFAVCALLFAAATTRSPFLADSDLASLKAIIEGRPSSLAAARPDLPAAFVALVHLGLEVGRGQAPGTLDALAASLTPFAGHPIEAPREALLSMAFSLAPSSRPAPAAQTEAEAAMLEAIARGDEPARLVYADTLEERGLTDHARWLRTELAVQQATGVERQRLLSELNGLRPKVGREFLATVGRTILEGCPIVFGFRCPMRWEALAPTPSPGVRYCAGCDSTVTFFTSLEEAQHASWSGACVAIDPHLERTPGDLDEVRGAVVGRIA